MFIIYYLLHSFLGISCWPPQQGPTAGGIVVNEGTLTILGQTIDPNWKHSSFEKALGKYNRTNSVVDIYDSTGLMLWNINNDDDPDETEITEFKILLSVDSTYSEEWFSKNLYTGAVTIEGHAMSRKTSWKELNAALPQYKFANSGHTGWYDGVYKNIYIFAQFKASLHELVYLAIGLDLGNNYD
jgi:hypothetical protein